MGWAYGIYIFSQWVYFVLMESLYWISQTRQANLTFDMMRMRSASGKLELVCLSTHKKVHFNVLADDQTWIYVLNHNSDPSWKTWILGYKRIDIHLCFVIWISALQHNTSRRDHTSDFFHHFTERQKPTGFQCGHFSLWHGTMAELDGLDVVFQCQREHLHCLWPALFLPWLLLCSFLHSSRSRWARSHSRAFMGIAYRAPKCAGWIQYVSPSVCSHKDWSSFLLLCWSTSKLPHEQWHHAFHALWVQLCELCAPWGFHNISVNADLGRFSEHRCFFGFFSPSAMAEYISTDTSLASSWVVLFKTWIYFL